MVGGGGVRLSVRVFLGALPIRIPFKSYDQVTVSFRQRDATRWAPAGYFGPLKVKVRKSRITTRCVFALTGLRLRWRINYWSGRFLARTAARCKNKARVSQQKPSRCCQKSPSNVQSCAEFSVRVVHSVSSMIRTPSNLPTTNVLLIHR